MHMPIEVQASTEPAQQTLLPEQAGMPAAPTVEPQVQRKLPPDGAQVSFARAPPE